MKLEKEEMKQKKGNKSKIIIGASVATVLTFSSIGGWLLVKNRGNDVMKFAQSVISGSTMKDTLSGGSAIEEKPDLQPEEIESLEEYLSALGFGYRTTFLSLPVESLIDDRIDEFGNPKVELLYAFCEDKKVYGWEEGTSDPEEVRPPYAVHPGDEPTMDEIIDEMGIRYLINEMSESKYNEWISKGRPVYPQNGIWDYVWGDTVTQGDIEIFEAYEEALLKCEEAKEEHAEKIKKYENWMTWKTARNEWIQRQDKKGYLKTKEPSSEWSDYTSFWVNVAQKALNLSQGYSTDQVRKLNNVLYAQIYDEDGNLRKEIDKNDSRKIVRDICDERLKWKEGDQQIFIESENAGDPQPSITPSPTGGSSSGGNTTGGNTTGGNTTGGNTTGGNTTGGNTAGGNTTGGNTTGGNNTPEQPVVDKVAPSIVKASITSPSSGVYTTGQEIRIRVEFDKNVYGASKKKTIDKNTAPKLMIKFGDEAENKLATFNSANGKSITYTYIVQETDNGKLQIGEGNNYIGTVYNGDGYSSDLKNIEKFETDKEIIIDTEAPKVESIEVISREGDYTIGEKIQIKVTFDKEIYTAKNKIPLIEKTVPTLNISFGEGEIEKPFKVTIDPSGKYVIYEYNVTSEDRGELKIDPEKAFDGTKTIYDRFGNSVNLVAGKELTGNSITVNKNLTQITLDKKEITLDLNGNKTANIIATLEPEGTEIAWTIPDPEVATIDEKTGEITAIAIGETNIIALTGDGATAIAKLTVKDTTEGITKVELNQTSLELDLNGTKTADLTASVKPKELEVTWSSTDEKIATVDEEGHVTAVAKGEAQIIAKAKDGTTVTCEVKVINSNTNEIEPTEIELDIKNAKVILGKIETIQLRATIKPTDSNKNEKITYESSDDEVATVDENGKVTIKSKGIAVITATSENGINAYCAIEVVEITEDSELKNKKIGDMNSDEKIDTTDFIAMLRHQAANSREETAQKHQDWLVNDEKYILADIDGNGKIDTTDLIKLQRHMAASKSDTLQKEKPEWLISSNFNVMKEMYKLGYKTADWLMKR